MLLLFADERRCSIHASDLVLLCVTPGPGSRRAGRHVREDCGERWLRHTSGRRRGQLLRHRQVAQQHREQFQFCLCQTPLIHLLRFANCHPPPSHPLFLFSGAYHIYVASETEPAKRLVGQYEGSGSFGELALMYNMPRAATVQVYIFITSSLVGYHIANDLILLIWIFFLPLVFFQAMSHGTLWAMDRTTFRRIVLKTACKKRKMYETLLETVPMLRALTVNFLFLSLCNKRLYSVIGKTLPKTLVVRTQ